MGANRPGFFHADIGSAENRLEFRQNEGLNYFKRGGVHCIEAVNDQREGFYVYLPADIVTGEYPLQIGLPSIVHVTDNSEAELYPQGALKLTIDAEGQFTGEFSGIDADGVAVENGAFQLTPGVTG